AEHPTVPQSAVPELRLPRVRGEAGLHERAAVDEIDVTVSASEDSVEHDRVRVVVEDPRDAARPRDGLAPRAALEVDGEGVPMRRVVTARCDEERSAIRTPARERVVLLAPRRKAAEIGTVGPHDVDLRVEPTAGRDDERDAVATR